MATQLAMAPHICLEILGERMSSPQGWGEGEDTQARTEDRSMDRGQLKRWMQKMQTRIMHSNVNIAMDPVLAQIDRT